MKTGMVITCYKHNIKNYLSNTTIDQWYSINWSVVNKVVNKLCMRIFQATKLKQSTKLKQLQTLMLRCKYNLLFSICRVTVINKGKETVGLDGKRKESDNIFTKNRII